MGILKLKEELLDKKNTIIKQVLAYFSEKENAYPDMVIEGISAAADKAYSDPILFEEFENWVSERDDDSFLYLINHYWDTRSEEALPPDIADLTGKRELIKEIKVSVRKERAQKFSQMLWDLAAQKELKTLEEIGGFLGVSAERARVMLNERHQPQRKTLLLIAKKFGISFQELSKKML